MFYGACRNGHALPQNDLAGILMISMIEYFKWCSSSISLCPYDIGTFLSQNNVNSAHAIGIIAKSNPSVNKSWFADMVPLVIFSSNICEIANEYRCS